MYEPQLEVPIWTIFGPAFALLLSGFAILAKNGDCVALLAGPVNYLLCLFRLFYLYFGEINLFRRPQTL